MTIEAGLTHGGLDVLFLNGDACLLAEHVGDLRRGDGTEDRAIGPDVLCNDAPLLPKELCQSRCVCHCCCLCSGSGLCVRRVLLSNLFQDLLRGESAETTANYDVLRVR